MSLIDAINSLEPVGPSAAGLSQAMLQAFGPDAESMQSLRLAAESLRVSIDDVASELSGHLAGLRSPPAANPIVSLVETGFVGAMWAPRDSEGGGKTWR